MKSLTFNNQAIEIFRQDGQIWLTSSELARALEYKNAKSITNLYNANSDEFSSGMTEVIESVTSNKSRNLRSSVRIFSLRGCHLIAMFARTAVAKSFRRWVLDILDSFSKNKVTELDFITERQAQLIQSAVNQIKMLTGESWQSIYSRIHQEFRVTSYTEIFSKDFDRVLEFLGYREANSANDKNRSSKIFALTLMNLGLKTHMNARRAYGVVEDEVFQISERLRKLSSALREIGANSGYVYDGLAEAQMYLDFDTDMREESKEKEESMIRPFTLENL